MIVHKTETHVVTAQPLQVGNQALMGRIYQVERPENKLNVTSMRFLSPATPGGLTNELLVDVLIHRIDCLDKELPSPHNAEALEALKAARDALLARQAEQVTETED